ncbi:SDR family oxidoreductase [Amycolatopsis rhabdoformis]|uniref:SDR family oxidoreductase n=1 Tax=Amycolatopsis rhabdoformis TaxID=1448059 RepID=A0ABZ1HWV9_9PSEU|nr:SDR family oxidoreductase [Amycolatopsis rhabdoformis]WSE26450.1 SDR family oxidoreductase [Amycolatopsis rhabdoformis]
MRVLITGASKGIGRTVADRLAAEGHHPIGLARSAPEGFPGSFHAVDLGDVAATARALDEVLAAGPVDAVVNNVGTATLAPLGEIDLDDVSRAFDLNFRTAIQVTQAALPGMRAAGRGRIVNVTSLVTLGTPNRTTYGGAKAALETATGVWAAELGTTGITVNAVAPGPTETELFRRGTPAGSDRETWFLSKIPAGRLGRPAEIAHAICFLLSDDASYITGQILRVDGGGSIPAA